MKLLVIGSGGREHALYWKLKLSPEVRSVHVWPGNGGIPPEDRIAKPLELNDKGKVFLQKFVHENHYDLVVIGPEDPLVAGMADWLEGIVPVFGPSAKAARLEGSKEFAKSFMKKYNIPTARAEAFSEVNAAIAYLEETGIPVVIKADGLAAGKGVTVAFDLETAETAIRECLEQGRFGASGNRIIIEEYMEGEEASVFAICDGNIALAMQAAQDHKRAFDNDTGPNTGGMGAYSPVSWIDENLKQQIQKEILDPVIEGMKAEGSPFKGLLYAGLMIDKKNRARVVEYNVRFGDPETQPLLRLLDEDLAILLLQAARGELQNRPLKFIDRTAVIVVLAAEGYPGIYEKEIQLKGLDNIEGDIICFHAGTERKDNTLISTGGRILGVTATGPSFSEVRKSVYQAMKTIEAPGTFYRTDIGGQL